MASNLRGGNIARMNYPVELNPDVDADADDRKLYQYSYYWTQTGSNNRYFRGNFEEDAAPEGWVRQDGLDWAEGPPAGAGWMKGEWGEDGPPSFWVSWDNSRSNSRDFGPDDRKLDSSYNYSYWTQTGNNNRYFRGDFGQDAAPEGWVRQDGLDWAEGPPAGAGWMVGEWGEDGSPDSWDSWDKDFGPDDPPLDSSYSYYYWTQTGNNNRYFRGNFEQDAPEGWVRHDDWIDGPPVTANGAEWVKGTWGLEGPPGSWDSWSPSEDGP